MDNAEVHRRVDPTGKINIHFNFESQLKCGSKGAAVAAVTGRLAGRLVTRLVSCECSIRLIEFAKSREVVAMATGDPAEDRGAGVTMATGMAVAGVAWLRGV